MLVSSNRKRANYNHHYFFKYQRNSKGEKTMTRNKQEWGIHCHFSWIQVYISTVMTADSHANSCASHNRDASWQTLQCAFHHQKHQITIYRSKRRRRQHLIKEISFNIISALNKIPKEPQFLIAFTSISLSFTQFFATHFSHELLPKLKHKGNIIKHTHTSIHSF